LVDAHDGALRIESRLGQGTTARVLVPSDSRTARMMLRLRHAGDAVEVARSARRSVTVALVEDYELRMEAELPASWARTTGNPARIWVIRDGLALIMTCGDLPVFGSGLAGACRVGPNMTFSGAVRAAAVRLVERRTGEPYAVSNP
jgi:hypothetical protein